MVRIVGVDAAAQDKDIGLALGRLDCGQVTIGEALSRPGGPVEEVIEAWLRCDEPCLLAIDAPLGWPSAMGEALATHHAGGDIDADPDLFFRRETDRLVAKLKRPLDVGADRIARTAMRSLRILAELRRCLGQPIPLAWQPRLEHRVEVIEVYPAATLAGRGWTCSGYKKAEHVARRREIVRSLEGEARLEGDTHEELIASADALDAAVAVLAGADFLAGRARGPVSRDLAEKEGWIWVAG